MFHLHIQSLPEISNRNLPGNNGRSARKAYEPIAQKIWTTLRPQIHGSPQSLTGRASHIF